MRTIPPEFLAAYHEHERELTIRKTRLGCALGAIFVPLFSGLDFYIYPDHARMFLSLRLFCSMLMVAFYPVIGTALGRKHFRLLGVAILFLPSATIAWMPSAWARNSPYRSVDAVMFVAT